MRAKHIPVIHAPLDELTHTRLDPKERQKQMLEHALRHAAEVGLYNMTRDGIAKAANVSAGLVSVRLGTMDAVRKEVVRVAIKRQILPIVGQAIAAGHPATRKLDADLQERAIASLIKRG